MRSKSRSKTASTRLPAQCAGTVPFARSHVVPQAGPQYAPASKGSYVARSASATGTGSPGTRHTSSESGSGSEWRAGRSLLETNRAMRSSVAVRSSCMVRVLLGWWCGVGE
ncbi:hypothetical protein GA0115252_17804 [Streptomyces sp. DfronAA-171]|nr:hypothetical protein GA0115252_17804 [Streptomyces sp. DfronAA-171]